MHKSHQQIEQEFFGLPKRTKFEEDVSQLEQSWSDFLYSLRAGTRVRHPETEAQTNGKINSKSLSAYRDLKRTFDIYHRRLLGGEDIVVIHALKLACTEGVPLPYWLAKEVGDRIDKTFSANVTLHAAFGLSQYLPETGKKSSNARKRQRQQKELWFEVRKALRRDAINLDAALRLVLKQKAFGFALTTARKLYNDQERIENLHSERPRKIKGKGISQK